MGVKQSGKVLQPSSPERITPSLQRVRTWYVVSTELKEYYPLSIKSANTPGLGLLALGASPEGLLQVLSIAAFREGNIKKSIVGFTRQLMPQNSANLAWKCKKRTHGRNVYIHLEFTFLMSAPGALLSLSSFACLTCPWEQGRVGPGRIQEFSLVFIRFLCSSCRTYMEKLRNYEGGLEYPETSPREPSCLLTASAMSLIRFLWLPCLFAQ